MPKKDAVREATGRSRAQWFALLDRWGAPGRPFREISGFLTEEHDVGKWWAQKLIVEYEQDRGLRDPGVRRDGTFEVGASRTVAVPMERLFDAFADARRRRGWLGDLKIILRASESPRAARFDAADGSRVRVTITSKGPSKAAVDVMHDRLTGAGNAKKTKAMWRERLSDLKSFLEG